MLRENDSPDKAVQFSNLYARLLTQPVLSQKWSILYLLHQLAGSNTTDEDTISDPARRPGNRGEGDRSDGQGSQVFKDAFASGGLPRLPLHRTQPKAWPGGEAPAERRSQVRAMRIPEVSQDQDMGVEQTHRAAPTESALLRDLPFTLQGLSSTNLPFSTLTTLDLPPSLPLPIVSLLHTLAEPSLLYRSLSEFVQSRDDGLIGQSLRSAIGSELRSYLGLIATLEGEIRRAITSLGGNEVQGSVSDAGVTLKRCVIWTREATMGLRLMSLMVEESTSMSLLESSLLKAHQTQARKVANSSP